MARVALFMDVYGWPCLVAGGSEAALRKAELLAEAGAMLSCWSNQFCDGFIELQKRHPEQIALIRGTLGSEMLEHIIHGPRGPKLILAAEEEPGINEAILRICEEHAVPCSVLEETARVSFAETIRRGDIDFAVCAERLPELERLWKSKLEREISRDWEDGSQSFVRVRRSEQVKDMHPDIRDRQLRDLAAALIDTNGRYAEAAIKAEKQARKML